MRDQDPERNRTPARAHFGAENIDRGAEVPIGTQLIWALRARIDDGTFVAGQRLPGLRELADEVGVNTNTVRAVYQRLEREGLIESQQGSGTFVASTLREPSRVSQIAASAARRARQAGVDPREVAAALYISANAASADTEATAGRRVLLRAQITALEGALGEIEAEYPSLAPRSTVTRPGPGPALLSVEDLERVRAGLVRRLATMQAAIDEFANEDTDGDTGERGPAPAGEQTRQARAARAKPRARPAPAGA
jgi:DNA-binding transcriptional regulator YhcF (GntR family)